MIVPRTQRYSCYATDPPARVRRRQTKYFQDECYSVSMHPSGLHVLVGFADKLRVMNVLDNDIRHYAEFSIKACSECRFSNGGHMFAAVNGNTIQIYNTYTCENTGTLRGHNGKVRPESSLR